MTRASGLPKLLCPRCARAVPCCAAGARSSTSHLEESAASHLDSNGSAAHLAGPSPPRPIAGTAASAYQAESGSPFSKATAAAAAATAGVNGGPGPGGLRRRPTAGLGSSADREQSTSGLLLALSREESLFGNSNSLPAPPEGSMELLVRELLTTAALEVREGGWLIEGAGLGWEGKGALAEVAP